MDIKDVQLFFAVVEEGSVTQAAKRVGYTESGASHIIRKLEKEMGFPLFARTRKGLVLTANGERLMPLMRKIVSAHEVFTEEASAIRGVQEGHIVIGTYSSTAVQWLPVALSRFHADYPNVSVDIWEGHYTEFEGWLEDGSIDLALTGLGSGNGAMDWIPLKKESFLAVCPPGSPYAQQDSFDLADLEHTNCILPCVIDMDLYINLQRLGINPKQIFTSRDEFTILSLVGQGLAISIRPELMLRGYRGDNVLLPIKQKVERTLGILVPSLKNASPAARSFIQYIQDAVEEIEGQENPPCAMEFSTHALNLPKKEP